MGLETVELVMDVEDHFGIHVKSAEMQPLYSVGDLMAVIRSRIAAAHALSCPSLAQFIRLRRLVRDVTGDPGIRPRPSEKIQATLSRRERVQLWRDLDARFDICPAGLWRPRLLRYALLLTVLAALLGAVYLAITFSAGALAVWLLFTMALYWLTTPFCWVPPKGWTTYGEVTRQLVGATVATRNTHLTDDAALLDVLKTMIARSFGIDRALVVPEALFVEDLGMG